MATNDKAFAIYLARGAALSRIQRDVKTPFENANLSDWRARLDSCRSLRAIARLLEEFETADAQQF